MVSLLMEDDCLAPRHYLELEYNGPNPFKVYMASKPILRKIFEVETKDLWERDFRWDIAGDPHTFYIKIYIDKSLDRFTSMSVEIIFQGWQPSDPNKVGKVKIKLGGVIKTRFPQNTYFQRSLFYRWFIWFYTRYFYNETRRNHLLKCRRWIEELRETYMELLGMIKRGVKVELEI